MKHENTTIVLGALAILLLLVGGLLALYLPLD